MKYCRHCGAELEDDAVFCGSCGKTQGAAADAAPAASAVAESGAGRRRERRRHPVLAVCLALIAGLLLLLALLAIGLRGGLSEETITKRLEDVEIASLEIGGLAAAYGGEELKDIAEDATVAEVIESLLPESMREQLGIRTRDIEDALEQKRFRKKLISLLSAYADDLLYGSGKGKLEKEDAAELIDIFADGLEVDGQRVSELYRRGIPVIAQDGGFYYAYQLSDQLLSKVSDRDFKSYSVKQLTKGKPIWLLRALCADGAVKAELCLAALLFLISAVIGGDGLRRGLRHPGWLLLLDGLFLGGCAVLVGAFLRELLNRLQEQAGDVLSILTGGVSLRCAIASAACLAAGVALLLLSRRKRQ